MGGERVVHRSGRQRLVGEQHVVPLRLGVIDADAGDGLTPLGALQGEALGGGGLALADIDPAPAGRVRAGQRDHHVLAGLWAELVIDGLSFLRELAGEGRAHIQFRQREGRLVVGHPDVVVPVDPLEHLAAAVGMHGPAIEALRRSRHDESGREGGAGAGRRRAWSGPQDHGAQAQRAVGGVQVAAELDGVVPGALNGGGAVVAHGPGHRCGLAGRHVQRARHGCHDQVQRGERALDELQRPHVGIRACRGGRAGVGHVGIVVAHVARVVGHRGGRTVGRVRHRWPG